MRKKILEKVFEILLEKKDLRKSLRENPREKIKNLKKQEIILKNLENDLEQAKDATRLDKCKYFL